MIAESAEMKPQDQLQWQFLSIIPKLDRHARIAFRDIRCSARRDDAIQECIALGWRWFLRLHERGKDIRNFTMVFVLLVVKAVKSGRRLAGMAKAKDVLNERCQQKYRINVETLSTSAGSSFAPPRTRPHGQEMQTFEERLQDNQITPIPDQVAFRMDWPQFFRTLPTRDRKMAAFLSLGNSNKSAAGIFHLTPGRVTQLRQRWCKEWKMYQESETLV